jgi:hypothetical protein
MRDVYMIENNIREFRGMRFTDIDFMGGQEELLLSFLWRFLSIGNILRVRLICITCSYSLSELPPLYTSRV